MKNHDFDDQVKGKSKNFERQAQTKKWPKNFERVGTNQKYFDNKSKSSKRGALAILSLPSPAMNTMYVEIWMSHIKKHLFYTLIHVQTVSSYWIPGKCVSNYFTSVAGYNWLSPMLFYMLHSSIRKKKFSIGLRS